MQIPENEGLIPELESVGRPQGQRRKIILIISDLVNKKTGKEGLCRKEQMMGLKGQKKGIKLVLQLLSKMDVVPKRSKK